MMEKRQGLYWFTRERLKKIYRTETHIHRHGTKLLVRVTEQNNYTKSILVLGKVEFQKSFLE